MRGTKRATPSRSHPRSISYAADPSIDRATESFLRDTAGAVAHSLLPATAGETLERPRHRRVELPRGDVEPAPLCVKLDGRVAQPTPTSPQMTGCWPREDADLLSELAARLASH